MNVSAVNPDANLLQAAEEATKVQNATAASTHSVTASSTSSSWWSATNAMTMCATLLIFCLIVLALSTYLLRLGKSGAVILRVFGTVLVITMALFLVVAGYDKEQIGAPLGLLGTIAGYLLGRDTSDRGLRSPSEELSDRSE